MTIRNPDQKQQPDPDSRDGKGRTRLHKACIGFTISAADLQQALTAGCDVNAVDNWGDTPLHTLINSLADDAAISECMPVLIEAGADINARGNMGMTPLHLAVKRGRLDCVRDLLQAQAVMDARNKYGATPLYEALAYRNTDMLTLLLEHDADAGARDEQGRTLLQMAEDDGNFACAQVLRQYGAEGDEPAEPCAQVLRQYGAEGDEPTEPCAPAGHVAAQTGAEADGSNDPEPETEPGGSNDPEPESRTGRQQ